MFLSNASVRRPVAMCCLIIALMLIGVNGYRKVGLEFLPKVDLPYITILTVYPGASPREIETDIAKRIENTVGSIDGLKHISNSCMENVCQTFLEFELDVDVDIAATDVREKLDMVINDFPEDAERPKILKFDINAKPVISMALTGALSIEELYDYADNELTDRLSTILGVAEVQLIGGSTREVHVLLDREILASRGLTSLDVVQALQMGVKTIPSGRVRQHGSEYSVKFDAEYEAVKDIQTLQLTSEDGSRCYLRDLGEVVMAAEERRQSAALDGRPCIAVRIVKKADANAVRVVERVREAVDGIEAAMPGGMELVWVSDDGDFIQASVDSAIGNIFQGVGLTALILFFFLYSFRSTLIVAVTMPLTMIISVAFLDAMGYTLNVSTLLAIGLSVGVLVTNSIVVLENIVKRAGGEEDSWVSARVGAKEIATAVLASAGTNVVVLFPIVVMPGQVGLFFKPFALTMIVVTLVSLFISFTLTPILCAVLLRGGKGFQGPLTRRMEIAWNWALDKIIHAYRAGLRGLARRRWAAVLVLALVALVFMQALGLAAKLGFGFFPDLDRGEIFIKLEYPTRYSLAHTEQRVREVEAMLRGKWGRAEPGDRATRLEHLYTTIGKTEGMMGQATEGVYLAQVLAKFNEKTERDQPMEAILQEVRALLAGYSGCIVTVSIAAAIGGQGYPIEMVIHGDDLDTLDACGQRVMAIAEGLEGFVDPDTSVRLGKPEMRVKPRRPVLADLGQAPVHLGMALRGNLEGLKAATFKRGDRTYDIRVKLREEPGKEQVPDFLFPGAPGRPMVLTNLARIEESVAPVQVLRFDKQRVVKFFSQLLASKPLGLAVEELSARVDAEAELPAGYGYQFINQYETMQEAIVALLEAAVLAIVMTYLVLAAILESFRQPFIILVTIPLALIGVFWALFMTGESLSMFVLLGGVMLIGIVVNNAILIMEEVNQAVAQGACPRNAMILAAGDKLRPILMISCAAVLGMLPLALGRGIGSEMRAAIGIASVGGIAVSAVLTLVVMPVLYLLFTRAAPAPPIEDEPEARTDGGQDA